MNKPLAFNDSVKKEFEAFIKFSGDCWLWTGKRGSDSGKYGSLNYRNKNYAAHRFAYELYKGESPNGFLVLHSCDNPLCVNPAHLRLGTDQQNKNDAVERGRHAHGITHGMSVLVEKDVREIRDLLKSGLFFHRVIADWYHVDKTTVTYINLKKIWNHVL